MLKNVLIIFICESFEYDGVDWSFWFLLLI